MPGAQRYVKDRRQEQPEAVTPIIPENATPHRMAHSGAAPLDRISGTTPAIKAIEVIRIAANAGRAASIAAA